MQPIGNVQNRPSRASVRDSWSFFKIATAGLRFALNWRANRRRELMATLEKYRLLAEEFRSRADLPNLEAQRKELLAYASHFEKCVTEIRHTNGMSFH